MKEISKSIKEKYKEQIRAAIKDLKTPGRRLKQLPNLFTASRLVSPLLIIPAALLGNTALAAVAAAGFGLTDLIDGRLADMLDARSELGADLDAFTDKIFAGTLLIGGAIFNPILAINIALEMAIAGINLKQKFSGKEAGSTPMGKKKTWAVFGLGALGIVAPALNLTPALIPILSVGTAALQGLTIASYVSKYNEGPMSQLPEEQVEEIIEEPVYAENLMPILYKSKTKEMMEEVPTILVADDERYQRLEELRELSDFFHQEQQNQAGEQSSAPKIFQKIDNNQQ